MNRFNVYIAKKLSDVFYQMKSISGLKLTGSCTSKDDLGDKIISLRSIPELCTVEKREHFIDFSSSVTISQILKLGKNNLPKIIYNACETIGNPFIKNLATIGGNIMQKNIKGTLFAPLLALDSRLEFMTIDGQTEFVSIQKLSEVDENLLLKKIRIPVEEWEIEVFKRMGSQHLLDEDSASFAFLAETQKVVLSKLRIAFAGNFTYRNPALEDFLIGSRLPLSKKSISDFVELVTQDFDAKAKESGILVTPLLREQFIRLLTHSLLQMSV